MDKMMMKNELTSIRETEAKIAEQSAVIHRRITSLRDKLAEVEAKITENASAAAAAQDALKAAMLADNADAITAARAQADSAAKQAAEIGTLMIEAQALKGAIATVENSLAELSQQSAALAPKVHAIMLASLDAEAESLPAEFERAARRVMAIYAKAAALSEQAQALGAGAGRYGPARVEPVRLLNVGLDRARPEGKLYAVATLADEIDAARAEVAGMLRERGF